MATDTDRFQYWTLLPILALLLNFGGFHRTLQRVRLANRGCLLLRTPGPVPFGTCICSNVETILSWTCHVYGPFEFRTSLGTSILLPIILNGYKVWTGYESFFNILCLYIPQHEHKTTSSYEVHLGKILNKAIKCLVSKWQVDNIKINNTKVNIWYSFWEKLVQFQNNACQALAYCLRGHFSLVSRLSTRLIQHLLSPFDNSLLRTCIHVHHHDHAGRAKWPSSSHSHWLSSIKYGSYHKVFSVSGSTNKSVHPCGSATEAERFYPYVGRVSYGSKGSFVPQYLQFV